MPGTLYGPEGIKKKIKTPAKNWKWSGWEMLSKTLGPSQAWALGYWTMVTTGHVNVWTWVDASKQDTDCTSTKPKQTVLYQMSISKYKEYASKQS